MSDSYLDSFFGGGKKSNNLLEDSDYLQFLDRLEKEHGLPSGLMSAIMKQESGGNVNAVSPKGAQGPWQIMPDTAKRYGVTNAFDPTDSAEGAARILKDAHRRWGGNLDLTVAEYNGGPGGARRYKMGNPHPETADYVPKVKANMMPDLSGVLGSSWGEDGDQTHLVRDRAEGSAPLSAPAPRETQAKEMKAWPEDESLADPFTTPSGEVENPLKLAKDIATSTGATIMRNAYQLMETVSDPDLLSNLEYETRALDRQIAGTAEDLGDEETGVLQRAIETGGEPLDLYGLRYGSNEPKSEGFLGPIPVKGGMASEYSISVPINGKEMEIPSIVPTLSEEQLGRLTKSINEGKYPDPDIEEAAIAHAKMRLQQGLSVFSNGKSPAPSGPLVPESLSFGDLPPPERKYQHELDMWNGIINESAGNTDASSARKFAMEYGVPFLGAATTLLPAVVASAATGSPIPVYAGIAAQSALDFGNTYDSLRDSGIGKGSSLVYALGRAALNASMMNMTLGRATSAGRSMVEDALETAGVGAVSNVITQAFDLGLQSGVLRKNITLGNAFQQLAEADVFGAGLGGISSIVAHPIIQGKKRRFLGKERELERDRVLYLKGDDFTRASREFGWEPWLIQNHVPEDVQSIFTNRDQMISEQLTRLGRILEKEKEAYPRGNYPKELKDRISEFDKFRARSTRLRYSKVREDGSVDLFGDGSLISGPKVRPEGKKGPAVRWMFIGEKAKEADPSALRRAKDLIRGGFDDGIVLYETGWFKGTDGKWRFEISDENADFGRGFNEIETPQGIFDEANWRPLSEVLIHPTLFKQYPFLSDIKVTKKKAFLDVFQGMQGWYSAEEGEINITPYAKDPLSTLLHEVQHVIQQYENFAIGGNEDTGWINLPGKEKENIARDLLIKKTEQAQKALEELENFNRIVDTPEFKELEKDKGNENLKARLIEKVFPGGKLWDKENTKLRSEYFLALASLENERLDKTREFKEFAVRSAQNDIDTIKQGSEELIKRLVSREGGLHQFYRRIAGEVEARNTQTRQLMSEEARRETPFYETEDVPADKQLIYFRSLGDVNLESGFETFRPGEPNALPRDLLSFFKEIGIQRPESIPYNTGTKSFTEGELGLTDEEISRMTSGIHSIVEKYLPGHDLTIGFVKDTGERQGLLATDGNKSYLEIAFPENRGDWPPELWTEVAAHEVGHLVLIKKLQEAPRDVYKSLYGSYLNWVGDHVGSDDFLSWIKSYETPAQANRIDLGLGKEEYLSPHPKSYWYSFDEYFAQHFSRWFLDRFAGERDGLYLIPQSETDKWLKTTANTLNDVYKELETKGILRKDMLPEEKIGGFLDAMEDKFRNGEVGPYSGLMGREGTAPFAGGKELPNTSSGIEKFFSHFGMRGMAPQVLRDIARFSAWKKKTWTIKQLADIYSQVPGAVYFKEVIDEGSDFKVKNLEIGQPGMRALHKMVPWRQDALLEFMWALRRGEYLNPGDPRRLATPQEILMLKDHYKVSDQAFQIWQDLLVPELNKALDLAEERDIEAAERIFQNFPLKLRDAKQEIADDFATLRNTHYFPMKHWGKLTVQAHEGHTLRGLWGVDTEFEQIRLVKRLRKEHPTWSVNSGEKADDNQPFIQINEALKYTLEKELALSPTQTDLLAQKAYELSPEKSFRKHLLHADLIEGATKDALRQYSSYWLSFANYLTRSKFGWQIEKAISETRRHLGELENLNTSPRYGKDVAGLLKAFEMHYNEWRNPSNDFPQLRGLTSFLYLGLSLGKAAVELSNLPLQVWPVLGDIMSKDMNAIGGRIEVLGDIMLNSMKGTVSWMKSGPFVPDPDYAFMRELGSPFLKESQATEAAGFAQGGLLRQRYASNKLGKAYADFMRMGFMPRQIIEWYNREVTFKTAYDLAMKYPNHKEVKSIVNRLYPHERNRMWTEHPALDDTQIQAFLFAKHVVGETMFEFRKWNKSPIMWGKLGPVFHLLKFTQEKLWGLFHRPGQVMGLALQALTAGLMGLPFMQNIDDIIDTGTKTLRKQSFSMRRGVRKMMTEMGVGNYSDELLNGGANNMFGIPWVMRQIGIPAPDISMSNALSLGQIFPGTRLARDFASGRIQDFGDFAGGLFEAFGGPTMSIESGLMRGILSDDPIFWRRFMKSVPGIMKYVAMAETMKEEKGLYDFREHRLVPWDEDDPIHQAEIVALRAGLMPTRINEAMEMDYETRSRFYYYKTQWETLSGTWAHLKVRRKPDDSGWRRQWQEINEDIRDFKRDLPSDLKPYFDTSTPSEKGNKSALWKSYERMKEGAEKFEGGLSKEGKYFKQERKLYPQEED
jgi:hypothetical protein